MRDQRHPHPHIDPRRPRKDSRASVNPPLFAWKPRPGDVRFGLRVAADAELRRPVIDLEGLTEPLHLPERPLPPGRYWWQWRAGDAASEVFTFDVGPDAVPLEVPAAPAWLHRLSPGHPRLHCRPEWLEAVRERAAGQQPEPTLQVFAMAEELLDESHEYPEPPFLPDRNKDFEANRRIWYPTMWGTRRFVKGAETLALAYLLSGDARYGRPACRRLASVSTWDPEGSTYLGHNDEAHMSVIWHGPHAADWAWGCFTEAEREGVIAQYRRRGQTTFEHMHDRGAYGIDRFDSHAGREIVFLALLAFTFHEHIPEARDWLEWLRPVLCGAWPIWAGDDGGWAQGTSYGLAYVGIQQMFVSAFQRGVGVDMTRKPFWRNHARWRRWVLPPYAEWQGFGDHTQRWHSSWQRGADLVELIGLETGTDEFDGYVAGLRAQTRFEREPEDRWMPGINAHLFLARLTHGLDDGAGTGDAGLAATRAAGDRADAPLPGVPERHAAADGRGGGEAADRTAEAMTQPRFGAGFAPAGSILRLFPTVGWAALRTRIAAEADGADDVAFVFRSSPFGSISHSHANNNDFILHVGGRVMAMPSGFYGGVKLGYGGHHHANWVWHTKSHNCVTLSDAGQIMRSEESTGRIDHAFEDEELVYFVGIADASYADRAQRCRRHVVFLKASSAIVMVDEFVALDGMLSTLQWNLHTPAPSEVDETERTFCWRRGDSQVTGAFLYHDNATFTLTEGWDPTPERAESEDPWPRQYHLRFTCNLTQKEYLGPRSRMTSRPPVKRNLGVVLAPSGPGLAAAPVHTERHGEAEAARVGAARVVVDCGRGLEVDGESIEGLAVVDVGRARYTIGDAGIRRA